MIHTDQRFNQQFEVQANELPTSDLCVCLLHCSQFVEALGAIAYEAGICFEDVMVSLGCRGPIQLTPEGSVVSL